MSTSIVNTGTESGYSAEGVLGFEGEAISSNSRNRSANGELEFSFEAFPTVARPLSAEGEIQFSAIANGHLDSDPDIQLSAEGFLSFSATAAIRNLKRKFAQGFLSFSSIATTSTIEPESAELLIIADLLPAPAAAGANIQILGARLAINGVDVPIRSFRFTGQAGSADETFQATLSKPYRAQVPIGATFTFDIYSGGVWQTRFSGVFGSRSYSIAFDGDSLQITSASSPADKLAKCPKKPVVYYDSITVGTLREEANDVLTDDVGHTYPTEFHDVTGLRLYTLLQWAFVTVCGFSAYRTNIPDFAIPRADFQFGQPVLSTIKALIGMYDPVLFELNNEIWILDSTLALPAGFTPRTIGADAYKDFSAESGPDSGNLDGLIVNFLETDTGDFYTQRFINPDPSTSGTSGMPGYVETHIEQEYYDYRNSGDPTVVVRSVLKSETKETFDYTGEQIGEEKSIFDFDSLGRATGYQKAVKSFMPNPNFYGDPYQLQDVRDERQEVLMTTDSIGRTRITERQTRISALVAIDSDNTYQEVAFKQDAMEAHKAGNLKDGMTSSFEPVKTITERFTNLNNGQTSVTVTTIDHLRGGLTESTSEADAGESLITNRQKSRRMIVWRSGFDHLSTDVSQRKLRELHIGPLPIKFGKPLAIRKLARATAGKGTASVSLFGFDSAVRRGATLRLLDRSNSALGDFFIMGFEITGSGLGTPAAYIGTSLNLLEL
jgi:hypothetical protein